MEIDNLSPDEQKQLSELMNKMKGNLNIQTDNSENAEESVENIENDY